MSAKQEYSVAAPVAPEGGRSWLPLAIAGVAGLLVLGLLFSIVLTPAQGATTTGGAAAGAVGQNAGLTEGLRVGALAPDFTLPGLKGGSVTLSSYRGAKPVWINFWATWCHFCDVEMPQMQKLYQQYQSQGLEILGVDDMESAAAVNQYLGQKGWGWTFLLDQSGDVDRQYRVTGLPTHLFVGRDGVIKQMIVGGISEPQMETALKQIMAP
jgi:peroxiredoxin